MWRLLILAADNPSPSEAVNDPSDWIVIGLTALCFIIFLQLMKRIAFGPIFALLEQREHLLTGGMQEIESERASLATLKSTYEGQLTKAQGAAIDVTQGHIAAGKKAAQAKLDAARQEYLAMVQTGRSEIQQEREAASASTNAKIAELAFEALDRILPEKIDRATERARVEARVQEAMR